MHGNRVNPSDRPQAAIVNVRWPDQSPKAGRCHTVIILLTDQDVKAGKPASLAVPRPSMAHPAGANGRPRCCCKLVNHSGVMPCLSRT